MNKQLYVKADRKEDIIAYMLDDTVMADADVIKSILKYPNLFKNREFRFITRETAQILYQCDMGHRYKDLADKAPPIFAWDEEGRLCFTKDGSRVYENS